MESFNGQRYRIDQGNFVQWFSETAFGGTNYSNTPVGAISYVNEPGSTAFSDGPIYFGLWASGKNFGMSAWNSAINSYNRNFQAVGDPLITK